MGYALSPLDAAAVDAREFVAVEAPALEDELGTGRGLGRAAVGAQFAERGGEASMSANAALSALSGRAPEALDLSDTVRSAGQTSAPCAAPSSV